MVAGTWQVFKYLTNVSAALFSRHEMFRFYLSNQKSIKQTNESKCKKNAFTNGLLKAEAKANYT